MNSPITRRILGPAIFLDRDGTLTVDHGYTHRISDFAFLPGVEAGLRRAYAAGLRLFIVTNQGGIALGEFSEAAMHGFHRHLQQRLAETILNIDRGGGKGGGEVITDIAFCPHHPDAPDPSRRQCDCRKPKPGMLHTLARRHGIDLTQSVLIGDRDSDMAAARAAGCRGMRCAEGEMLAVMEEAIAWCQGREGGR